MSGCTDVHVQSNGAKDLQHLWVSGDLGVYPLAILLLALAGLTLRLVLRMRAKRKGR